MVESRTSGLGRPISSWARQICMKDFLGDKFCSQFNEETPLDAVLHKSRWRKWNWGAPWFAALLGKRTWSSWKVQTGLLNAGLFWGITCCKLDPWAEIQKQCSFALLLLQMPQGRQGLVWFLSPNNVLAVPVIAQAGIWGFVLVLFGWGGEMVGFVKLFSTPPQLSHSLPMYI